MVHNKGYKAQDVGLLM